LKTQAPIDINSQRSKDFLLSYQTPETTPVLDTCIWLKSFKSKVNATDNREVIYILSILARLDAPADLITEYFSDKPGFNLSSLNKIVAKIKGPVTCRAVGKLFECGKCPKYKKCHSPIEIREDSYIESQETGFHIFKFNREGKKIASTLADYRGLVKHFDNMHEYKTVETTGAVYKYHENYWQIVNQLQLERFADKHFNPKPNTSKCKEFSLIFRRTNSTDEEFFFNPDQTKINLNNYVYDFLEDKIYDHSPEFGLTHKLPYDYDPDAKCPNFEKFLDDVTVSTPSLKTVILEYLGYCLSGAPCKAGKALILYGGGANGKSTFLEVLKALVGKKNYSAFTLSALNNPQIRAGLENKLFNIGEETNKRSLADSEIFKTLVTGGEVDIKKLYEQPYSIRNRAKIIVSANVIPTSNDKTDGLYRRLLIVPFKAKFTHDRGNLDIYIEDRMLGELSGIFNLAIKNFKTLRDNRYIFTPSNILKSTLEDYKYENDNCLQFIREELELLEPIDEHYSDNYLSRHEIYSNYVDFARTNGTLPVSNLNFFKTLEDEMNTFEEFRLTHLSKRIRAIKGLRFI